MIGAAVLFILTSAQAVSDQRVLDHISTSCGLSAGDITINRGKLVRIRPRGTPSYEAITCTLPKLKKTGFTYPVGFISQPTAEPRH